MVSLHITLFFWTVSKGSVVQENLALPNNINSFYHSEPINFCLSKSNEEDFVFQNLGMNSVEWEKKKWDFPRKFQALFQTGRLPSKKNVSFFMAITFFFGTLFCLF